MQAWTEGPPSPLSAEPPPPAPRGGLALAFSNIRFTVKDRKSGQPHDILKGISGEILPNRLTVIMGSSGAGKTTLLDVLSCNVFGAGEVSGEVLVNGRPLDPARFAKLSSYVPQRDVLDASSTVREAVALSALLTLGPEVPMHDKVARVDAVLQELDLLTCQQTLIGDELLLKKGISGGQRRRVSVGIELVKQPTVLFLDEPSSGLDSDMALSLVATLSALARRNRTVVATLHQPNSHIAALFDDFLLLHCGAAVYSGTWKDAVDYFAARGCPCPQYMNPPDHFIAMLKDSGDALVQAWSQQASRSKAEAESLADVEAGEGPAATAADAAGPGGKPAKAAQLKAQAADTSFRLQLTPTAGFGTQVSLLSGRMLRQWVRNPDMLLSEAVQYVFMAVFVGLVWLQLGTSLATGPKDRACSLWFALAILSLVPSFTAVTIWDKERLLLRRESQRGMYNVTAWFLARTLTTVPMQLVQAAAFCVAMYWMVGYAAAASNFFIFVAAFCLFCITSETIGEMCGFATRSSTYASIVLSLVMLVLLPFAGYLVSHVPVYFRWLQTISFVRYTYSAVMMNEMDAVTFQTADGVGVPGAWLLDPAAAPPELYSDLEQTTLYTVDNGLSVGANLGVLAGFAVATRLLAFLLLYLLARLKWL